MWRLCLQIAFSFFYSVWIVGLVSTPGESGLVFSTTHEREALHFKNSLITFQHNQHRPFTAITLTLVVSRFLRETFWIFTHLDFFLVLMGKDVKFPNMVLYWTVMAWCFLETRHTLIWYVIQYQGSFVISLDDNCLTTDWDALLSHHWLWVPVKKKKKSKLLCRSRVQTSSIENQTLRITTYTQD